MYVAHCLGFVWFGAGINKLKSFFIYDTFADCSVGLIIVLLFVEDTLKGVTNNEQTHGKRKGITDIVPIRY
ncbi:hypothetical protein [Virgibacillus salexigens]|uniref:hypothetical protein n=1 Tax=Virgibacillus massiliensis TaxID=1462526 RepID=UPI00040B2E72|nr:hypothetical protein [Virgibacillus massiliensis]